MIPFLTLMALAGLLAPLQLFSFSWLTTIKAAFEVLFYIYAVIVLNSLREKFQDEESRGNV